MRCVVSCLQQSPCYRPCLTVGLTFGAAAAVAGIFLTLAALQVLPSGVNAISQLGQLGNGLAYAVLGGGSFMALLSLVLKLSSRGRPLATTQRDHGSIDDAFKNISISEFKKAVASCQTIDELFNNPTVMEAIPFNDDPPEIKEKGANLFKKHALIRGEFKIDWRGAPYIACQLECISSKQEIARVLKNSRASDLNLSPARIMFYKDRDDDVYVSHRCPYTADIASIQPLFLDSLSIRAKNHPTVQEDNQRGFQLFKQLLCDGEGEDLQGLRWKFTTESD